ncbi:hypothetical protein D3C78_1286690 [compost metagenome]
MDGVEALLVQLDAIGTTHQGAEQQLGLAAQAFGQVAPQAEVEQPEAGLRQHQPDQQQCAGQPEAEPALDRPHRLSPVKR